MWTCIMRFLHDVMLCYPAVRGMSLCHSPELDLAGRREYLSTFCTDRGPEQTYRWPWPSAIMTQAFHVSCLSYMDIRWMVFTLCSLHGGPRCIISVQSSGEQYIKWIINKETIALLHPLCKSTAHPECMLICRYRQALGSNPCPDVQVWQQIISPNIPKGWHQCTIQFCMELDSAVFTGDLE